VAHELARLQAQPAPPIPAHSASANGLDRPTPPGESPGHRNGSGSQTSGSAARTNGARGRSGKPATPSQAKAIYAIARAQHSDLQGLLRDEYGVDRPEDLSLAQASAFIDQLKAVANT
jgi:hypothetical protein